MTVSSPPPSPAPSPTTTAMPQTDSTPKAGPSLGSVAAWPVIQALAGREFVRFLRQRSRVAGSLGQPLLFWLVLGAGLSPSFQAEGLEGVSYMEYFYPGVLMMMVLFASVFSTITVIEDRDAGFLQGVITAPVPRIAIVLGKVGGAAGIALFQAIILLCAAPFLGFPAGLSSYPFILGALVLVSLGYTSLGFLIAWGMASTSGFHAIMMLLLMPMWLVSGAFFPMDGVHPIMEAVMWINPVTHGMTLIRMPFYDSPSGFLSNPEWLAALGVVLVWITLALWASVRRVARAEKGAPLSELSD